ncbi:hypothetical protein ABH931_005527 [Streptacidiphilus sp. MAP12-33]|uniref:WhiB family transcriptional regulator n=1 Tax=Streptacidiphilus sp. MAP12-33 TaxID=3156266 RepID=UPI0035126009
MPKRRTHLRLATVATPAAPQRGTYITLSVPEDTRLSGAVCREVAPDVFFPEPDDTEGAAEAKRLCAACAIRPLCLAGAIERDERYGIFGGLNTAERDALSGRPGCGTRSGYRRHLMGGEPACAACRAANTAASAADRAQRNAKRQPSPGCGTRTGYQQHRAAGERVCAACLVANTEYVWAQTGARREDRTRTQAAHREAARQRRATETAQQEMGRCCGTRHGYRLHRLAGEPACDACLEANTAYSRAYRKAHRTTPAAAIGADRIGEAA